MHQIVRRQHRQELRRVNSDASIVGPRTRDAQGPSLRPAGSRTPHTEQQAALDARWWPVRPRHAHLPRALPGARCRPRDGRRAATRRARDRPRCRVRRRPIGSPCGTTVPGPSGPWTCRWSCRPALASSGAGRDRRDWRAARPWRSVRRGRCPSCSAARARRARSSPSSTLARQDGVLRGDDRGREPGRAGRRARTRRNGDPAAGSAQEAAAPPRRGQEPAQVWW